MLKHSPIHLLLGKVWGPLQASPSPSNMAFDSLGNGFDKDDGASLLIVRLVYTQHYYTPCSDPMRNVLRLSEGCKTRVSFKAKLISP